MEQYNIYIWGVFAILMVILEVICTGVLQVWFAIGAMCAAIVAYFEPTNYLLQLLVFLVVSGILVTIGSMIFKNKKDLTKKGQNPVYSIIGKEAIVTKDINTTDGSGQIKVSGEYWSAKGTNDEIIPVDTKVKVLEIDGVKAVVEIIK